MDPWKDEAHAPQLLSAAIPGAPEDRQLFRLAQLTVLLEVAQDRDIKVKTVDRLALYDFLAANPFIVVSGEEAKDSSDRLDLRLAGFSDRQLSYASTGERFISRRSRVQHDVSLLYAYGLISLSSNGYGLTRTGRSISSQLHTIYADGYREAARIVLKRLGRLSDKQINLRSTEWLGQSWLLVDLMDDIAETVPGSTTRQS